jgi:hypothetical protein
MNADDLEPENDRLAQRLRAGARSFGPEPSPALRSRILAGLRTTPRATVARGRERAGTALAAAAAALVLCGAWWLTRGLAPSPGRAPSLVRLSRDFLDAGARMLTLPGEAEGNLRLEATRLLSDTTRVAEGVVRGLPGPLRSRLERM